MAKNKKNLSDKVRNRQKGGEKKINPFEVKVNKQKHNVMGRKISKHDRGMPGLSRSKAIKRREQTLIHEYDHRLKKNKFVDKRFGEHDTKLSVEEKMLKRFAMERSHGDKANKFSLNEDEELTHYGQSLSEIEKFEDPDISDEEEEDDKGKISGEMVSQEHFGGFMSQTKDDSSGDQKKSWKERMEELIVQSKKQKYERQKEKEKSQELTEQLDSQFRDIRLLLSSSYKKPDDEMEEVSTKKDDYDMAVRSLTFESRGQATDRLKTEEELAKEEKERLEKLEEDRLRRMRGETDENKETQQRTHISADDLDDGYLIDENLQEGFEVCYKDGKLLLPDSEENKNDSNVDEGDEDAESNDSAEEEEDDDENMSDDETKEDESNAVEEDESDYAEDEDDSDDDSYKDVESDGDEEEKDTSVVKEQKTKPKINLKERKEIMDAARKELPYTFQIPETYDELLEILQDHTEIDQLTIIQRIKKCYHPSLAEGNKAKLEVFFSTILQYYCDLALQTPSRLKLMDKLTPELYSLTRGSPVAAGQAILDQIKDRQDEFKQICQRKAGRGLYPALDTLLLLKLVSVLFPTSDFRHPVTTPALLFINQMLAQCPVNHERDVAAGLFLCNLCLEFVTLSKRYIPEVINFLHGILFLAANKDPLKVEAVIHPFKPVGDNIDLLKLKKKQKEENIPCFKMSEVLTIDMEIDTLKHDKFRLCALHHGIVLLAQFAALYKELPSYKEIFLPIRCMCGKISIEKYPRVVQENVKNLMEEIEMNSQKTRKHLIMKKKKPMPLKMFEPQFEEEFNERKSKRKTSSKDLNEKQKLVHKYRKELKGAMREIRKDTQALARKQLRDQLEKDEDRKRKVKQIYQSLASQEGDFKADKRAKKS